MALDPLYFYCFLTFKKLWLFNVFNPLLYPIVGIQVLLYHQQSDFVHLQTSNECFLIDNRKKLSVVEQDWVSTLLSTQT